MWTFYQLWGVTTPEEAKAKINQQKEGLTDNIHYLELDEVAPKNTLQFLLDRYKGKTVFIDLWATWCAPCRAGHQAMEPVKQELKDKDIVYVYITDATSEFDDWKRMVKNISGEHYYLSPHQFESVCDQFHTGGDIPAYIIYNPKGELVHMSVGFEGAEPLKKGLMKALE